ncbi:hypothetical protein ATSB10_11630 [Dyella thiooxydans]|uniref:DUF2238 domain-containing protein n=1 Tax=Dyella thiooxydans TaxID=445710 RepID=A0A160N008_9GAMM|nr:DUF2238 domain-containing protein [Dyella thiooxydans]AND68617.1 hypothetical protein ATSB10_11630 [Dyella thiooxydans]
MVPSDSDSDWRFPALLLGLFLIATSLLGIAPRYRQDWLLENAVVLVALPLLTYGWHRLRFSRGACIAMFAFLLLHEVGAHYTYSEVPYDAWFQRLTGHSLDRLLGFPRNEYDRLVHFLYGLLVTPMAVELLDGRAPPRGIWRWILPVTFVMSHSVVYELVEWLAAVHFGSGLGTAYLGTQGDPWDAQKDMALAALGSVLAMLAKAAGDALRRGRDCRRQASGP